MPTPLERYRKVAGTGPGSTIGLEDWNGLLDEAGGILAALIKKGADFDAVATVAIGVLLDRINDVLGPAYDNVQARGAQVEALYARLSGEGVSADAILETADRLFWTAARAAALKADLLGNAPAGRQTLKALNDAILANTATLAAITGGADPTLDSFAEVLMRLIADEGQISGLMTALGNRLRLDAAGGYSDAFKSQGRANLLGAPASVSANGAFAAADVGRKIRASGTITRTLPAISGVFAGWATGEIENTGTGIVTVAAGAGDAFEGVVAGSLALLPKQRAYFYLDTDGWHVGWVERSPIIAALAPGSAVAAWDLDLPAGYKTFQIIGTGFQPGTAGAIPYFRLSDDGGATLKSGATDYAYIIAYSTNGGTPAATPVAGTQGQLAGALAAGGGNTAHFEMRLDPGGGGMRPTWENRAGFVDNASGGLSWANYEGLVTSISTNRANRIRLFWSTGTGVGGYTLIGVP